LIERHGWTLLFHDCLIGQLTKLQTAAKRARKKDPEGSLRNANVKLFEALAHLILEVIPGNPGRDEYRQGKTLGPDHRHWRRARIGRRFRLFFRYDSTSRTIVYAWVNDAHGLRSSGSKSDPYAVFRKMLGKGNPPDDWEALVASSRADWLEP